MLVKSVTRTRLIRVENDTRRKRKSAQGIHNIKNIVTVKVIITQTTQLKPVRNLPTNTCLINSKCFHSHLHPIKACAFPYEIHGEIVIRINRHALQYSNFRKIIIVN